MPDSEPQPDMADDPPMWSTPTDGLISILVDHYPEPMTASEIAEETDIVKRTVHKYLEQAVEAGAVQSKKPHPQARVYCLDPDADGEAE